MKKKVILLLLFILLLSPFKANAAAKTLGDLKNELASLKAQKSANDAAKNKTESQIASENTKIKNANAAVEQAETDIEVAKKEIEKSNNDIDSMKDETEKLLAFYEIMSGSNDYLEYISGSSSITEMVMRSEAVNQVVNYNQDSLKKLEEKIVYNEQLQVQLAQKQVELEKNIKEYEKSIESLNNDLSSLVEITLDINSQITAQQKLIKYYEDVGCKDADLLTSCVDVTNNTGWLRPLNKGYISSGFGYRSFYLNGRPYSDYHPAVDIAGVSGGTQVYSAASGTVAAVLYKASCGGNQVFIHTRVQGQDYTMHYAHLQTVNVKVGDTVTNQTIVGTLGGGGSTLKKNGGWDTCSTGYHLHFGISKGFYLGSGYSSYSKFVSNGIKPPNMPEYGKWFYSR